ncbi:cyclic peptide export ABC transporter [Komagataeibacter sp. AV436]|uniref:Cyclic peptide export ABC transporter n=1 Tax=Komagataeibacter melomenusus TaxID=2766578 RepID=A0ABX2A922_9PROT|nr:cyclic peptide export ABC transporter [Komagataeibacter melomenusus]MBV1829274.1 cyclic peptide export ABC transporter [Komagataeibacter melomenusus]NPC64845.1 cyclic peptide export ABC transporter [Komagataeibacter melomenusus]
MNRMQSSYTGVLRALWRLQRPLWPVTLGATLVGTAGGLASAWLLSGINDALHAPDRLNAALALNLAGLCVLSIAGSALAGIGNSAAGQKIITRLRHEVAARVLATPLATLERHKPHRMLAILNGDISTVSAFTFNFSGYVVSLAVVLACVIYLAVLSPPACLIVIVSFACGVALTVWRRRRWRSDYREIRSMEDRLQNQYRTITEGARELQLNHMRRDHVHHTLLGGAASRIATLKTTAMRRFWLFDSVHEALFFLTVALLLGTRFLTGLSTPAATGAVLVLLYARGPLERVLQALPAMTETEIALQRIAELTANLPDGRLPDLRAEDAVTFHHAITLHGVSYHPDGMAAPGFILGPVDLTIRHGEVMFITGGNGAGKTTLVKLLLGLYAPTTGSMLCDGVPVMAENVAAYRQLFATVFTDYFLFENLPHPDERTLALAAYWVERLGLAHKVRLEQGRFSTTDLSTGQCRRLALVQALAEHRPVLMLDEWAADQDPVFRRVFYTEILPELKAAGRTLIVISHDDHYFATADHIIHLDEGRIINDSHPTGTGQERHATRAQGRHPSEKGTLVPPAI